LIHRDIKPANLMLVKEDDEIVAKVIDFGLAKTALGAEGEDAATLSLGGFVGTPHFASPEQLEERELDVRSDIYSLGVTLWYMLAGQPPFGGSMALVMSQHLSKPPPFEKVKTLPPPVTALLKKMLEKDPAQRFQTPTELRRAIEEVLGKLAQSPVEVKAAAEAAEDGLDTPIEQEEFATLLDVAAKRPGETRFEAGVTIAGRYRIVEALGETNAGRVFRADDTAQNRSVRLLVLHQEVLNDSAVCTALEREVERLTQVSHPNLLGIFNFETIENASFLAMEWTDGFSVLELLRARRELGADEAIKLLKQAAEGVDYALKRGLTGLEFGLHQLMLHFDGPFEKDKLLRAPMFKWPEFALKLYPLGVTRDLNAGRTWAGQTMVGGAASSDADGADAKGRYIRSLATVIYELLGGTISPLMLGGAGMPASRYTPLSTLTEEGNEVLKRALDPAQSFGGAKEFCDALAQPDGMHAARRETALPVARREAPPSVARREPAPPVPRREPPPVVARQETPPPRQEKTPPVARREPAPPIPRREPPPVARREPEPPVPIRESAPPMEAGEPPQPPPVVTRPAVSPLAGSIAQRARPPKKSMALVVGGAVALLAIGGGGYFLLHKSAEPPVVVTDKSTPEPKAPATPEPRLADASTPEPRLIATPAPLVIATPIPKLIATPAPTPTSAEKLATAIKVAEGLEQQGDKQEALGAYLKVLRNFPEIGADRGRKHIDSLLEGLRQQKPAITRDQFESMRDLLTQAAQQDMLPAMLILGKNERRENPAEAYKWFLKAADSGSPEAMHEIGMMLASPKGIPGVTEKDESKAFEYFEKAAKKNYAQAVYALGECYLDGKGVEKNEGEGMKLIRKAAAAKEVHAMNKLGTRLTRREDPRSLRERKEEFQEAFNLFTEAGDLGFPDALGNIAVMYFLGYVPGTHGPDNTKGAKLFLDGAQKGSTVCMIGYARCLEQGIGVKPNQLESEKWGREAARLQNKDAIDWCMEHHYNVPAFESPSLTGPPQSLGGPQQSLTQ